MTIAYRSGYKRRLPAIAGGNCDLAGRNISNQPEKYALSGTTKSLLPLHFFLSSHPLIT